MIYRWPPYQWTQTSGNSWSLGSFESCGNNFLVIYLPPPISLWVDVMRFKNFRPIMGYIMIGCTREGVFNVS